MNTKALLEVKQQILEEPESFQMLEWVTCDTVMCIGGHLAYNAGWRFVRSQAWEHEILGSMKIVPLVAQILEMDEDDLKPLLYVQDWDKDLARRYWDASEEVAYYVHQPGRQTNHAELAAVAAEQIDRFIARMEKKEDEACAVAYELLAATP